MPAWLAAALRLIATGLGGGVGFGVGTQILEGPIDPSTGSPELFGGLPFGLKKPPRRRRRRALTHSDKDDIAFLAATVGETTARKFALIIAAHSSR